MDVLAWFAYRLCTAMGAAKRRGMTLGEWVDWQRLVDVARD